jgi:hypothetical protein
MRASRNSFTDLGHALARRREMRARRRFFPFAFALCLALLGTVQVVQADLLTALAKLGKIELRAPPHILDLLKHRSAGAAIMRGQHGELELITAGAAARTSTYRSTNDLVRAMAGQPGDFLVPEDMVTHDQPLLDQLVAALPDRVRMVMPDGSEVPLTRRSLGDTYQLVVAPDKHLSLSLDAWDRTEVLNAPIMHALLDRLRVVALVPGTDQVQRQFLQQQLGNRVGFAATEAELTAQLAAASRRIVVILGHVEDGHFVLRNSRGQVLIDRSVDAAHELVDRGHSMALLMGCGVACAATRTGPLTDIDALEAVLALSSSEDVQTPLQFFQHIAATTGPMHVESDALGRLRGISEADLDPSSMRGTVAAAPVRLLLATEPKAPITPTGVAMSGLQTLIFGLLAGAVGWVGTLLLGLAPRRTWRVIRERYVFNVNRAEIDDVPMLMAERMLLLLFGPWTVLATIAGNLLLLPLWGLVPFAFLLGKPLLHLGLSDQTQLAVTSEPLLAGWLPRWVNAAIPPIATALALTTAQIIGISILWPRLIPWSNAPVALTLLLCAFLCGFALQRVIPLLRRTLALTCFALALPSSIVFHAVHALSRIPTVLARISGTRRHA